MSDEAANKEGFQERIERYFEMRDDGVRCVDAAREVGVSVPTGRRYERAWKTSRGVVRVESVLHFDW